VRVLALCRPLQLAVVFFDVESTVTTGLYILVQSDLSSSSVTTFALRAGERPTLELYDAQARTALPPPPSHPTRLLAAHPMLGVGKGWSLSPSSSERSSCNRRSPSQVHRRRFHPSPNPHRLPVSGRTKRQHPSTSWCCSSHLSASSLAATISARTAHRGRTASPCTTIVPR